MTNRTTTFLFFKNIEFREKEVALVAKEPLLRNDVGVLMVGVPVKVASLVKRLKADRAGDSHASKASLMVVSGCCVRLEDRHSRQVHFTSGAHQPSVDDALEMHLE